MSAHVRAGSAPDRGSPRRRRTATSPRRRLSYAYEGCVRSQYSTLDLEVSSVNGNGKRKRYSLRAILLGLTLVCVVLGMLAYARTPRPIHRRLEALGGQVETAGLPESANALRWCDALFGPLKRFHEIEIVEIQSDKFTDQELTRVCQLGTVGFLLANSAHVSDEGLRSLCDCNELDTLYLIAQ